MISISHKKDCCGCGACAQKCPKQCITMQADPEGFLYPEVDTAACIHCGLCEQACPILKGETYPQPEKAYAAFATDDQLRKQSSSGGVFSLLAGDRFGVALVTCVLPFLLPDAVKLTLALWLAPRLKKAAKI